MGFPILPSSRLWRLADRGSTPSTLAEGGRFYDLMYHVRDFRSRDEKRDGGELHAPARGGVPPRSAPRPIGHVAGPFDLCSRVASGPMLVGAAWVPCHRTPNGDIPIARGKRSRGDVQHVSGVPEAVGRAWPDAAGRAHPTKRSKPPERVLRGKWGPLRALALTPRMTYGHGRDRALAIEKGLSAGVEGRCRASGA